MNSNYTKKILSDERLAEVILTHSLLHQRRQRTPGVLMSQIGY